MKAKKKKGEMEEYKKQIRNENLYLFWQKARIAWS